MCSGTPTQLTRIKPIHKQEMSSKNIIAPDSELLLLLILLSSLHLDWNGAYNEYTV